MSASGSFSRRSRSIGPRTVDPRTKTLRGLVDSRLWGISSPSAGAVSIAFRFSGGHGTCRSAPARFGAVRIGADELTTIHGKNEKLSFDNCALLARFYTRLIQNAAS